jgi:hypothetical protein
VRVPRPRRACRDTDCACRTAPAVWAFVPVAMISVWPGVYQRTSFRSLDRNGRVGVHGDASSPVLGGFNGGAQLSFGEGRRVEGLCGVL